MGFKQLTSDEAIYWWKRGNGFPTKFDPRFENRPIAGETRPFTPAEYRAHMRRMNEGKNHGQGRTNRAADR